MIATCGHKVFEGISCSLQYDENTSSYGTYCVDCLKRYYKNGFLEPDTEVKKLLDENNELIKENKSMRLIVKSHGEIITMLHNTKQILKQYQDKFGPLQ